MILITTLTDSIFISIIKILIKTGEVFVDGITEIQALAESQGLAGAIALLLILIIIIMLGVFAKIGKGFASQMTALTGAINILTDKVSSPYMEARQSVVLFRAIMSEDIQKKLTYIGDILTKNSIKSRRTQIEINIAFEFKRITAEETEKLSAYKSVCGDMGKVVNGVLKWPKVLQSVYDILFSEDKDHQKIIDIKTMLKAEVDNIARIIEDNGIRN